MDKHLIKCGDGVDSHISYIANSVSTRVTNYGINNWDGWVDNAYKTVTFFTSPTGDLLTWLQVNGTKQEPNPVFVQIFGTLTSQPSGEEELSSTSPRIKLTGLNKTKVYTVDSSNFFKGKLVWNGTEWQSDTAFYLTENTETEVTAYTGGGNYIRTGDLVDFICLEGTREATQAELDAYTYQTNVMPYYVCIVEGTQITLAYGTKKPIQDIIYNDNLLVWNFYEGKFDTAKPRWIKIEQVAHEYNLCKFSNGAEVGFVGQGGNRGYHRIYNDEVKCFTNTGVPETPIGTTTFAEDLSMPTLVEQEIVHKDVKFYNIITDKHFNLFANGILTSCRLSNKYAIEDMKYVGEQLITDEQERAYFDGIENIKA